MLLKKARAMLQLIRPELPIAAGICVVVGQAIALGALPPLSKAGMGFLLGVLLSSSAMVFNDLFDLEVDRINAPGRPLPAGLLSLPEAVALGVATGLGGLLVALLIHPIAFALSLLTWTLGFLYNWRLKANGLWGNLIVSASVAMTFILGGVETQNLATVQTQNLASLPMLWVFAGVAFCFDLAEEIAGDAMDIEGDRKRASRSLAIRFGKQAALRISAGLFALVIALTFAPAWLGEAELGYWIPIAVMDGLIVFFSAGLLRSRKPEEGRGWMRRLYISATLGLVAFVVGTLVRW